MLITQYGCADCKDDAIGEVRVLINGRGFQCHFTLEGTCDGCWAALTADLATHMNDIPPQLTLADRPNFEPPRWYYPAEGKSGIRAWFRRALGVFK